MGTHTQRLVSRSWVILLWLGGGCVEGTLQIAVIDEADASVEFPDESDAAAANPRLNEPPARRPLPFEVPADSGTPDDQTDGGMEPPPPPPPPPPSDVLTLTEDCVENARIVRNAVSDSQGEQIVLGSGTICISEEISVPSDTTIRSENQFQTVIRVSQGAGFLLEGVSNVAIHGLAFELSGRSTGLLIRGSAYVRIWDNRFAGAYLAILVSGDLPTSCTFVNNAGDEPDETGLYVTQALAPYLECAPTSPGSYTFDCRISEPGLAAGSPSLAVETR